MNLVTAGARNVAEMRGVRIGLIGGSLGGDVLVTAMAFGADSRIRLLGRRVFAVTRGAIQPHADVLIDQKPWLCAGCRRLRQPVCDKCRDDAESGRKPKKNEIAASQNPPIAV